MKELFVPALLSNVVTLDPGELRVIELTLPPNVQVEGGTFAIHDSMRPGTAFLAKPLGARTGKIRRRMYSRSNCSSSAPLKLETVINYTHSEKADTSLWWQTDEVSTYWKEGRPVDVRVDWDPTHSRFTVFEHSHQCRATDLRLEPDEEWMGMRFLCIAFSTGVTPFLAYVRYMRERAFGQDRSRAGAQVTLVASARHPRQLIAHQELLHLEKAYPDNFRYHPVLTREWPDDWAYTKGRIMRECEPESEISAVDVSPLLAIVPDLDRCHVRLCGNRNARDQLLRGLKERNLVPLSLRAEVW